MAVTAATLDGGDAAVAASVSDTEVAEVRAIAEAVLGRVEALRAPARAAEAPVPAGFPPPTGRPACPGPRLYGISLHLSMAWKILCATALLAVGGASGSSIPLLRSRQVPGSA